MSIFLISSLAAGVPIVVYILFLRWLDRYEREPFKHIFITFLAGAVFSSGLSYVANTFVSVVSRAFLTTAGHDYIVPSLVAPLVEEFNKGMMVVLFAYISKEFDNITDGLLYGAVVGLGFAFAENIHYFMSVYNESGLFAWIHNMYFRSLFCAGLHAAATATFGACMAYGRHARFSERIVSLVVGYFLAVMIHSFWNSLLTASTLSHDTVLGYLPVIVLPMIFLMIFVFFQISLARESEVIEQELTIASRNGIIPENHVPYLKSYLARSKPGWLDSRIPKEEYIAVCTEFAFLKNRFWNATPVYRKKLDQRVIQCQENIQKLLAMAPTDTTLPASGGEGL